ncbi:MAG TPA: 16S rRNA (guanine(527)-N(7))-methyltransferase RsmG [Legionellaceae bacterium]|nr:16S rRNA (guanine(527)-N(7))-methyltransferase RsmG [Legionellaceae bacterium]
MIQEQIWLHRLATGICHLDIIVDVETVAKQCLEYIILLHKWNHAYNLTAIRTIEEMIDRHILDSLAILPRMEGSRVLDVGTGAGLPGIPLALSSPTKQVVLLDSNGKKTRFLTEVKRCLSLSNIEIVQARVEDYQPTLLFNTVVSRAFADIPSMLDKTEHLLLKPGKWVAMKGPQVHTELTEISYPYHLKSYVSSGACGKRYCVIIEHI